ncbi:hypothetical protein CHKEEEPN_0498 [Methylorubrum podarium]|jgi:transposase|nr:hypothetical protein CHKEEEPN_0498 [Methylorubrum podarium]
MVRLIAPQLAKPYVRRGKNDAADAAALCEAASRPSMRFVPVKTPEAQAALMLAGQCTRLVRQRVQLANTIRGHAGEFGIVAANGAAAIGPLLVRLRTAAIPDLARALFAELAMTVPVTPSVGAGGAGAVRAATRPAGEPRPSPTITR